MEEKYRKTNCIGTPQYPVGTSTLHMSGWTGPLLEANRLVRFKLPYFLVLQNCFVHDSNLIRQ